ASTGTPYRRILYERLIQRPTEALASVLELVGRPVDGTLASTEAGYVEFSPSHSVSGNPIRFRRGRVPLMLDDEWQRAMPWADRMLGCFRSERVGTAWAGVARGSIASGYRQPTNAGSGRFTEHRRLGRTRGTSSRLRRRRSMGTCETPSTSGGPAFHAGSAGG